MNKIFTSCIALLGAIGVHGTNAAEAQSFRTVAEARAYLAANPTGRRAQQAFRVIADATLSAKYPEFSRRALADGKATSVKPGAGASRGAIDRALAALSQNAGPAAPRRPATPDNNYGDVY